MEFVEAEGLAVSVQLIPADFTRSSKDKEDAPGIEATAGHELEEHEKYMAFKVLAEEGPRPKWNKSLAALRGRPRQGTEGS